MVFYIMNNLVRVKNRKWKVSESRIKMIYFRVLVELVVNIAHINCCEINHHNKANKYYHFHVSFYFESKFGMKRNIRFE